MRGNAFVGKHPPHRSLEDNAKKPVAAHRLLHGVREEMLARRGKVAGFKEGVERKGHGGEGRGFFLQLPLDTFPFADAFDRSHQSHNASRFIAQRGRRDAHGETPALLVEPFRLEADGGLSRQRPLHERKL